MKKYRVAVVGATGAVGTEMLNILKERKFPVESVAALASERSAGKSVKFGNETVAVSVLDRNSFAGIDFALFSAGGSVSQEFAPVAAKAGAVVIDNTSAFRMDKDVPLVVPEVNPADAFKHKGIIANPNCSTIQMVVALKPIHDRAQIRRIVVSTYQAVSGAGQRAMTCLLEESRKMLAGEKFQPTVFPYQIAFNLIPQIDVFTESGYTKEELKMVNETKKIMGDESIRVSATTVRVPVLRGHSESVNVETARKITAAQVKELLKNAPGVVLVDEPENKKYPLPIVAAGTDPVYVGRIREDLSIENGINLWVVSDNLRKGAALNAVQIAELFIK